MTNHAGTTVPVAAVDGQSEAPAPPTLPRGPVVGIHKRGLRVRFDERTSQLALLGRADPVLLYVVLAAAFGVAFAGGAFISPEFGFAGGLMFAVLLSPLVLLSSVATIRLRTECLVDRPKGLVRASEQSYLARFEREWPLAALEAVAIVTIPPRSWAAGARTYELHLVFAGERYLAKVGSGEGTMRRDAHRLGRFVGAPVIEEQEEAIAPIGRGRFVLTGTLFALPVAVATILVFLASRARPPTDGLMIVSIGALVVCQLAALVAFGYDRTRRTPEGRVR